MKNRAHIPTNEPARIVTGQDPDSRFWYWRGVSGRRYIHSIYDPGQVPPLPGAIYVAARRVAPGRCEALACGVFPRTAGARMEHLLSALREKGAEEIHVHLLASSPADSLAVRDDLSACLGVGGIKAGEPESMPHRGIKTFSPCPRMPREGFRDAAPQLALV